MDDVQIGSWMVQGQSFETDVYITLSLFNPWLFSFFLVKEGRYLRIWFLFIYCQSERKRRGVYKYTTDKVAKGLNGRGLCARHTRESKKEDLGWGFVFSFFFFLFLSFFLTLIFLRGNLYVELKRLNSPANGAVWCALHFFFPLVFPKP